MRLNRCSAAAGVIALLLMTSCTRPGATHAKVSPTPSPTPAQTAVTWTDCGDGFQCGYVTVPIDYSNPSTSDTIRIALVRKRATDPSKRIGSVLTNPGGPGASGIDYLRQAASSMTNLNKRFDLVGFDPRGVGQSAPIRCLDAAGRENYDSLDGVLDDPQEKQAAIQADKDFATACARKSGKLLPYVDTVSAARDMDVMRAALGDAQLTYLGLSYGTYLGQVYAQLFPTHVRALSLDGVVDPNISPNDLQLLQVRSFQSNLDAFFAYCRSNASCLYARSGDPAAKLRALLQHLDTTPMAVGSRLLTRALALYGVGVTLYNQSFWKYLDQGLTATDQGNGTILMALSDAYLGRQADGSYDNEVEANWAVNCLDRPVPTEVTAYDALGPSYTSASSVFGPFFQYGNLQCAFWPVKATGKVGPITAEGAPPILLVGGTNDPATPYAWAQSVHRQLAGSVLLTRRGNGHVSYDKSACIQAAEDAYMISLTLPAPGTVCS